MSIGITNMLSTGFFPDTSRVERHGKSTDADDGHGDRISFSQEALALAKQALYQRQAASHNRAVQDTADATSESPDRDVSATNATIGNNRRELFREFRSYVHRDNISFPGMNTAEPKEKPTDDMPATQSGAGGEKNDKKISTLERQLKDLTNQLEQVLTSDISDVAKEELASGIKKKMDELLGRLQALKTEEQTGQTEREGG